MKPQNIKISSENFKNIIILEWESHSTYGIKSRSIKDETRESTTQNQCFSVQHKQSEKINDNLGKTSATFATD